ncbi:MAG: hypothetical protein J0H67_01100 [Rhodospirillales bacterium]|nr:hypothetical protein [Rhodospirillales bacterium]MBN8909088.1 hypothetical protein [Rhodospirillales bacterium]
MSNHAPGPHADSHTLGEVERLRALVMNLHGLLRGTQAAHLANQPIEAIHRSLDRITENVTRRGTTTVTRDSSRR